MTRVTIVVPCYNEAARLDVEAFATHEVGAHDLRFLFVNDGSTDDTGRVLRGLKERDARRFDVHELPKNAGKAEAVRQGISRALAEGADYVGFWDADLATPLAAIETFCAVLDERPRIELAMGSRVQLLGRDIQRRAVRHFVGRVFATMASLVLGLRLYDTQCGAKLFRATPAARRTFEEPFLTRWFFDVEIVARLVGERREEAGEVVCEIPLERWHDVAGSKLKIRDFITVPFELLRIRLRYF